MKTKTKQISNAPPPITPIQPGAVTTTPDRKTITNAEYRALRGMDASGMKKRKER